MIAPRLMMALATGLLLTGPALAEDAPTPPKGLHRHIDTNSDGKIDRTENDALEARMFQRLDRNQDGVLSAADAPPPVPSPQDRFAQMVKEADTDGDGVVSLNEFKAKGNARFDSLDADKNGVLTADERPNREKFRAKHAEWRRARISRKARRSSSAFSLSGFLSTPQP
ncbi:EF-hand domain-containing protein [Hankyongella ginsenosidimutans]|nr:EF-hand domain-containing protein [Hankyongella ginsenosidimutans]